MHSIQNHFLHLLSTSIWPIKIPAQLTNCPTTSPNSFWIFHHPVTSNCSQALNVRPFHPSQGPCHLELSTITPPSTSPFCSNNSDPGLRALSRQQFLAQLKTHLFKHSTHHRQLSVFPAPPSLPTRLSLMRFQATNG